MSYFLEFNRYVFREAHNILIFRKIGTYNSERTTEWEVHLCNERGYWELVSKNLIDTQNGMLKRAVGWNDVVPFNAAEYARIYEGKLRNAKNFAEMLNKFRLFASVPSGVTDSELIMFTKFSQHSYHLKSKEEIVQWIRRFSSHPLQFNAVPANYFTRRGSI